MSPTDTLSPGEAARLTRWGQALGWDKVAARTGTTWTQAHRAARLQPILASALPALRALIASEPEGSITVACCTCGAPIEGAPNRRRRACAACREVARRDRLTRERERMRRVARLRLAPAPAPEKTATPDLPPCPECGAARRREGKLVYCPQRCDAGLVLTRRAS